MAMLENRGILEAVKEVSHIKNGINIYFSNVFTN